MSALTTLLGIPAFVTQVHFFNGRVEFVSGGNEDEDDDAYEVRIDAERVALDAFCRDHGFKYVGGEATDSYGFRFRYARDEGRTP